MEPMTVFVMALFISISQADFHMSLKPPQRVISLQIGETFEFLCEAFDCPNPTFTWASLMDKTLSGTVNTEGSRSILTMQVSAESEGSYLCKVFCNQHKEEKSFTISVYSFPSEPVLHISSLVAEVQSNIICTVPLVYPSEMLSLSLLKNKEVVSEYDSSMEIAQDGGFQLRNASLSYAWIPHVEDEGSVIECEAEMSFVDDEIKPITRSTNVTLSVAYPPPNPNITVQPSKSVQAGKDISLYCSAESRPQATVRWVKESGNVENELPSENGHLGLTEVKPQESGKYICYAENEAGRKSASVVITVQGVPSEPEISILPATTVIQGQAVTIKCVGHISDINTQVTLWKETLMLSKEGIVHIERADPMDTAMYKCKASNQYGEREAMESLTVQFPPKNTRLTITPSELVREGDQVIIQCTSEAFPTPTLILKEKTEHGEVELETTRGMSVITSATVEHSGTYTCKSINPVGNEVAELSLSVQVPPKNTRLTITPSELVREGDQVIIQCTSEAFPTPTLILKEKTEHGEVELETTRGMYIITSATVEHSGTYTCKSINPVGNEVAELSLSVQVPPKNTRLTITPSELVREGDQVIIQCTSEAFPTPTLILKEKTEHGEVELETTRGMYIITSATVEHSGTYTCKSINPVGNEVAELSLSVQVPPQNTTVLVKPSKNVMEGDTVTITCETHSSPLPTILLKKVCTGTDSTTQREAENGTFTLHNVTRNDTGTYVISIINEAGNTTEVIQINVQARYQSPQYSFATPIIATSLFAVSAAVIGLIVYHMKQVRLQGSYSLVNALRSRV
ncbi:vascular cell adhesion protein 1 [Xenopus laevis]|uniref:Vascular cell adhesion protein 1 n=1 Tax=Xenopus laevis TaxID=8355 RepID=A0A8J1MXJ1_XENLA|nr:vascular cell adhesion protein 1 [Xenopus laevis]